MILSASRICYFGSDSSMIKKDRDQIESYFVLGEINISPSTCKDEREKIPGFTAWANPKLLCLWGSGLTARSTLVYYYKSLDWICSLWKPDNSNDWSELCTVVRVMVGLFILTLMLHVLSQMVYFPCDLAHHGSQVVWVPPESLTGCSNLHIYIYMKLLRSEISLNCLWSAFRW